MFLRLLGSIALRDDGGTDLHRELTQPKRVALLAYLAAQPPGELVRRDTLLALLWPELPERDARRALNQAVHYLRTSIGSEAIVSGGVDTLGVDPSLLTCDVARFDEAVRDGRFSDALELYRGPFMEGFNLDSLPEFDDWLTRERASRALIAADAAWSLADAAAASAESFVWGNRGYAISSDEGATRRLIALYDRHGDRAEAIRLYEAFAKRLCDEYGATPSPETQALIRDVRDRQDVAPSFGVRAAKVVTGSEGPRAAAAVAPKRVPRLLIAVVVAMIVAIGALVTLRVRPSTGAGGDASVLAILPFEYRGAPNFAYLGEGVASLLASSLDGSANLRTVDPHALFGAVARRSAGVEDAAAARDVARSFGAGLVVLGDIVESSGRLRISAELNDGTSTGERVVAEGAADHLFEVVDALAAKLMTKRGMTDPRASASITTSSIPALRAYISGSADYRAGRYEAAVQSLRRAVDADSTFALAHYLLANAASWTGDNQVVNRSTSAAYAYRERLTPHDRAKVEAFRMLQDVRVDSAEAAYDSLVHNDPTDVDPLFHLADIHYHWGSTLGRPVATTGDEWRRVVALDPENAGTLLHAARVAAMAGESAHFDSLAARLAQLDVDPDRAIELEVIRAFAFGDDAARRAAAKRLGSASQPVRTDIVLSASAWSPTLAGVDDVLYPILFALQSFASREDGKMLLRAEVELARGKLAAMRATMDSTMSLNRDHVESMRALFAIVPGSSVTPEERRRIAADYAAMPQTAMRVAAGRQQYLLALLALRDGDRATARRHVAALDTVPEARNRDSLYVRRLKTLVEAELARASGDYAGALRTLGAPQAHPDRRLPHVWSYPLAHERFLRAQLAADLGRFDEAQRWYATFPDPSTYDLAFYPSALESSAALYEKHGDRDKAAAQRRRLAALRAGK